MLIIKKNVLRIINKYCISYKELTYINKRRREVCSYEEVIYAALHVVETFAVTQIIGTTTLFVDNKRNYSLFAIMIN